MDVVRLTKAVQLLAAQKLNLRTQLDNAMFNHISYVTNRCLMIAKKEGIGSDQLEQMGKYLWRLFRVVQAYNHKKRDVTLTELVSIVDEFKSVFTGV
jgi:hypothetical protein